MQLFYNSSICFNLLQDTSIYIIKGEVIHVDQVINVSLAVKEPAIKTRM